jgi:ferredoxin
MSDRDERRVAGLRIEIDRGLCVGFGDCVSEAPAAFRLDAGGLVTFADPEGVAREHLLRAGDACPVDAITIWDAEGRQLAPARTADPIHSRVPARGVD